MWMREVSDSYYETHDEKYSPLVWKEYFKKLFLGEEAHQINGKAIITTRHTSKLLVDEFCAFLTDIDIYCAKEFECLLTHPALIYDEAIGN